LLHLVSNSMTTKRIFLAGATGALGRRLVPQLVERGHTVFATTRSTDRAAQLSEAGAEPVILDPLDADAVREAVARARPEVVVHELTALSDKPGRNFDKWFALTNRLRTEGTDILIDAARTAGARRLVWQSYAGWPFARQGGPVKAEDDPLDPEPPDDARESLAAIRHLEAAVTGAEGMEGVVLRYGGFYGPGTSMNRDGEVVELIRKRRMPVVGDGAGVWSFVHIDDAAAATVAAVEGGPPGIYNVVDDEPTRTSEWLPAVASSVGAKPPRHMPGWLVKLAAGPHMFTLITGQRGASNAKAKRELAWTPAHTWREIGGA
jgi:nucleoside-diphosphate-sugar epimerase